MKKELLTCCLAFLTAQSFAVSVADNLDVDSVRNEKLDQYLDTVFGKKDEVTNQGDLQEERETPKTKNGLHILKLNAEHRFSPQKLKWATKPTVSSQDWNVCLNLRLSVTWEMALGKVSVSF